MPKVLDKDSILFSISEQRLGYEFGNPKRVDESALSVVLPILRHSVTPRSYISFPETEELEIIDTGLIDTMMAHNKGKTAVFLRSGTIFKGATQERASLRSMVVVPGFKAEIKVRCVHQSRGISTGAKVGYAGNIPLMMEKSLYSRGFSATNQMDYWNSVRQTNYTMTASMGDVTASVGAPPRRPSTARGRSELRSAGLRGTRGFAGSGQPVGYVDPAVALAGVSNFYGGGDDDLSANMADFAKNFDKILSKVEMVEDQVGLALITEKGCETLEVFDAHDSWKALHKDAINRLGPTMAQKDKASVFEYKPERAVEVARGVLALPYEENVIFEHKANGYPALKVVGLSADDYTGEVVEWDGKVIHLMLLKMEH